MEVCKALNIPRNSACVALRKLRIYGLLEYDYALTNDQRKRGQRGTFSYYYRFSTKKIK